MADMCFELLRQRRTRGLTQMELARRAGVGARTVIRLERGEIDAPSSETLRKLASALGTRPELLFPELLSTTPAA